jgi:hypothetical protein
MFFLSGRNQNFSRPSIWADRIWVTRAALMLGLVAIAIGLTKPRLFQLNIIAWLAFAAIMCGVAGIVALLWGISLRSRRWRDKWFWLSIVCNLAIVSAVAVLYLRGMKQPPYPMHDKSLDEGPEMVR